MIEFKPKREIGLGEYYRTSVSVKGIKKRARIPRNHFINIGYFPVCELSEEKKNFLNEKAKEVLARSMREMLPDSKPYLVLNRVKIEDGCIGIAEHWEPFSDKNLRIEVKA